MSEPLAIAYVLGAVLALLVAADYAMSPKFRRLPRWKRLLVPVGVAAAWPLALLVGAIRGRR